MSRILITGAFGQLGTELTTALRQIHGMDNVLVTGRHLREQGTLMEGPTAELDVTDGPALLELVRAHRIEVIYHLAARLSAVGEQQPQSTWRINMDGLHNVLEAARQGGVKRLFWPSSIAVFGPETPRDRVPQDTVMRPTTIYGVTKVAGELLCDYYVNRYGLDVRGVRYPGVISSQALPGGGTTDYAVEIFHQALKTGSYTCFVREDTVLPMIYMPDCIKAAVQLMETDQQRLRHQNGFNIQAMSFSAAELAAEIGKHVPGFVCHYQPDQRQAIADSWPRSLDDSAARHEWDWNADFDLGRMTRDMLQQLAGSQP
jgi:nucleoside-diphosphate-sugar epimerase